IRGVSQPLSWSPVSLGGITVTMSNPTATNVRVTLTGPSASLSLPQTFELVGRDTNGAPVVKYGFTLKQWFFNSPARTNYSSALSWCNSIGRRLPRVEDLTNAVRTDAVVPSATPSSRGNYFMRHIGSGFLAEWGRMPDYSGAGFNNYYVWYWTSDLRGYEHFSVGIKDGYVRWNFYENSTLCSS
ncbi:hypothetical protein J3U16_07340, partial [Gilliamella sp. B3023]